MKKKAQTYGFKNWVSCIFEYFRNAVDSNILFAEEKGYKVFKQPDTDPYGFAIGFTARWQLELIQNREDLTVCLDSTHGTTRRGYSLYTIVVKHREGFGVPSAYLITKDESRHTLRRWLEFLKAEG